ncbi:MAG: glutamate--tRNA ligase [Candidatus Pacearchaeota archaeon]|nr:glutamate--tRNA ligase [Candidatus Pacearchaeota archaeon]
MDLSKEIMAYALQNAIEHGEAKPEIVLPKLFQHGLDKKNISAIMPIIKEAVNKVNSMSVEEREKLFEKLGVLVKKHEGRPEGELQELPGIIKGKKPIFRLAPFPSGALHIGNAKTFLLNALYAEKYNGEIILVMDDTIGSAEKPLAKESYNLIKDAFDWLGIKYKKIVYKSDRLKIYYKYAEELIKKNKAYVCYCSTEELRENRLNGVECSCRQFPPGLQKERWKELFKIKEGHGVLRIKTDMMHPNPAFRDRVLFKVTDREHPRVGKKYRVWPSLEMSWAIDDHLLEITHIIRGNDLMMETEMEKYIWNILKWKYPSIIHTGLIRIEGLGAKISKSKARKEVLSGEFGGWDDPRTWSMQSLKRRGINPEAIKEFVSGIGLNKQDIAVPIETLYSLNRKILDEKSMRYSFVLNPRKLKIETILTADEIEVPVHPKSNEKRKVKIGQEIFISENDFEKYNGEEIRLIHLFNTKLDEKIKVVSIENKKIPKLNWVSYGLKTKILMPDGIFVNGLAEESVNDLKIGDIIQFERFGFVRYDGEKKGIKEFWFAHN